MAVFECFLSEQSKN